MADSKKNTDRFSIQFNSKNPKYRDVVDILNSKGRNKAEYIAKAILEFENNENQRELILNKISTTIKESINEVFTVVGNAASQSEQRDDRKGIDSIPLKNNHHNEDGSLDFNFGDELAKSLIMFDSVPA